MKVQKIRIADVVPDYTLAIREINRHIVAQYAESMKMGADFPPLMLDEKTKRIVGGFQRYTAYVQVFEVDHKIPVVLKSFKNKGEMLIEAIRDNGAHGLPLTSFEKKLAYHKAKEYKISADVISDALLITKEKLEKWDDRVVIVKNKGVRPLKRGLSHLEGSTVTEKVYNDIEKNISGWSVSFHVKQILLHVKDETIDRNNVNQNSLLTELRDVLSGYLKGVKIAS